jgi:CCR4-NOT transcription complex subunit 1
MGGEITKDPEVVKAIFARFGYKEGSTIPDAKALELISTLSNFAFDSIPICDATTVIQVLSSFVSASMPFHDSVPSLKFP